MEKSQTSSVTGNKSKVFSMVLTALMAAILCATAPIALPIGPVPVSLATFVLYIIVVLLGWKLGTLSCLLYLLIGLVGVPVFSGYAAGPAKLFGPTGGYLIGYILLTLIAGFFCDKFKGKIYMYAIGMVIGTAALYTLGTAWLAFQAHMTLSAALAAGVIPFLAGDAAKIVVSLIFAPIIKKQLVKAGLLSLIHI